jgi:acyl-CoA reductase-like NAD-dependent aldehyde dehydrogenase
LGHFLRFAVDGSAMSEAKTMVAAARTAQQAWGEKSPFERAEIVGKVADRILARGDEIASTLAEELGKPAAEAWLSEVVPSADLVRWWCSEIEGALLPEEAELDPISFPKKEGVTERVPRGVIGVIMPWNFPVALPLRTLIPALLAGNGVVFKGSEVTPKTNALVASLFEGILPPDLLGNLEGDGRVGAELPTSGVDLIVFTGSVATGRKVAVACAEELIPASLELGGKDAAIVLADANLDRAAQGIVWGAFTNAGQNCASIERVYVVESVAAAFTEKVVALVKTLKASDVGPLATAAQKAIVTRHVDGAVADGKAEVLVAQAEAGGAAENPLHYAPTVLKVTDEATALIEEESFGPLLPIVVVKDGETAVARANASKFGLTASIWTKKPQKVERLIRALRGGVVTVNNHAFTGAMPMAPWSGVGLSGYGVTNSRHALDAFTRPRFVLIDRNSAKRELWWYPYTDTLVGIARALATLKRSDSGIFAKIGAIFTLLKLFPKRLGGG